MKPIIMDMKDMSESREVYESRPNPVMAGFIYLILAMAVAALLWMGFCRMDIVVKATGTIGAVEEVATVTNRVAGTITERMIEDGQRVEKGDVLYTVSHEELTLQLSAMEEQLADLKDREEMLQAYGNWLETGEEFPTVLADNPYYSETVSRKLLAELGEQSTLQAYAGELSAYEAKLYANSTMTDYYSNAIDKSRKLIEAVKKRENPFGQGEDYYRNYMENYLSQYQNTIIQYDDRIRVLQKESSEAAQAMEALEAEKQALQNSLRGAGERAASVSGSDAEQPSAMQIQQQIQGMEAQIAEKKAVKEAAENSIKDYNVQKSSALNSYEKENIAAIENSITGLEQNLAACEGNRIEYSSGQETLEKQGVQVELANLTAQEKNSVAGELEACRQSQSQLKQQMEGVRQSIENATVRAAVGGNVNFAAKLAKGDYVGAGVQVLTIIPESETGAYVVTSYVENKDIAKVHEGMEVTYEIGAYPSREYGTMKGKVTFVSADLKVNNNGSAYYVVKTDMDAGQLRNQLGEEAALKVGMLCETKIVVEEKSVLEVLLEKLFHLGRQR